MKNLIIALFLSSTLSLSAELRTWTSTKGSTLEAELVDFANRTVVLKSSAGRRITLSLDKLSEEDQLIVTEWASKQKITKTAKPAEKESASSELKPGLADLLPETILDSKGKEVSRNQLAGKVVGFYFSAHWCPPCRTFTPRLVEFRDEYKDQFEVVFVSSDRSPQAQMDYMQEANMKWFTLPHRSQAGNLLAKKYGIRGIPSLIIVSPEGETITKEGRGQVSGNPKGAIASWTKSETSTATSSTDSVRSPSGAKGGAAGKLEPGLAELLPEELLDAKGKKVSQEALAGKMVGFYFSAHWCPPCRTFTPRLVEFRDDNKDEFEIVFVSSDKSPQAQMDYMKETNMKWLTLPHRSKAANKLKSKYGIRGIPALVIVAPNGETITKDGRGHVSGNPRGALASWRKSI